MAQVMLSDCGFKLLLKESEIKKEVVDICVLACQYCQSSEDVDIYDPYRNTYPFICSHCCISDAMEFYQNGIKRSADTAPTNTTHIASIYYVHFVLPDIDVSS